MVNKYRTPKMLVSFWTEFVGWEKRKKGERGFFARKLKEHNCNYILDTALGDGVNSVRLIQEGFKVESNEIDEEYRKSALKNASKNNVELSIKSYDWRELTKGYNTQFDSLICLGNSLTYLLTKEDQIKALKEMFALIKNGGILIIDHRNYDYILDKKNEILRGNFIYSRKYYYCSDEILSYPVNIENNYVIMEYYHPIKNIKLRLKLYPFRIEEMKSLLKAVGFKKIETYYDFKKEKPEHFDFVQHIAIK